MVTMSSQRQHHWVLHHQRPGAGTSQIEEGRKRRREAKAAKAEARKQAAEETAA